jgi:succinate dehydrogenase / fumarate reductase iron-sulfur subunit
MKLTLHIWRQKNTDAQGQIETHVLDDVNHHMSFLEMLDLLNEKLVTAVKDPVAFDSDCREGICGACSLVINGMPHGPQKGTTACQLHMRHFEDGDEIWIEPFRAKAFPVIKDLVVDRSAFDRVIEAGGYVSVNTGSAPDANSILIGKESAEIAFEAAACIGCGACVAACKNASAMLFVSAKVGQFANLPQGQPERQRRVLSMVEAMDQAGFGNCTNQYECEAVCPKTISAEFIAQMNRDYLVASVTHAE